MKFPNPKDFYDENGRLDFNEFDKEVEEYESAVEERTESEKMENETVHSSIKNKDSQK